MVCQVFAQTHIYNIGVGRGDLAGRFCRCMSCKSEWALQAGTIKGVVDPTAVMSLDTLIKETFPRFYLIQEDRLKIEAIVRRNPHSLDASTRQELLTEPFLVLDGDVRRDEKVASYSWQYSLGNLCVIASIGSAIMSAAAFLTDSMLWGFLWLVPAAGLGWLTSFLWKASTNRYMRKHIYPRLASCLAPLAPSLDELLTVKMQTRSKCSERTRMSELITLVEKARTEQPGKDDTGDTSQTTTDRGRKQSKTSILDPDLFMFHER